LGTETFESGYYQIAILAEYAYYAPLNNLSWYPISSDELHQIFSGANTTGDTTVFNAEETFGLALGSPDGLFFTEATRNPDGFDHALVFANPNPPGGYIIVWEDLWEGGDKDFQDMILAMLIPVIKAKICICPNTLCLKSKGQWITCFINLLGDYDESDIDVSTIRLNGTIPAESKPVAIIELKCNGDKVLMVKFSRKAVIELIKSSIETDSDVSRCKPKCTPRFIKVTLTVSGKLFSGQAFEGSTRIRAIHFKKCAMGKDADSPENFFKHPLRGTFYRR
jgi:hypothetical protein